jgi:hypothetical protein
VSGDTGGGEALIGGDYQGKNSMIKNAWRTYIDKDATINADASNSGDGGKVIVWADDTSKFYGHISSVGGALGGDGGFTEVSGKNFLDFQGTADLSSRYGEIGTLLLDPDNVEVKSSGLAGVGGVDEFADTGATRKINANTLNNAAANVTIQANNNITVDQKINLTTSGATLTFQAKNNITLNQSITTNDGAIKLIANNDFISTKAIDSGTATTIIASDAGTIGLGDSTCKGSCDMTISSTELSKITAANLKIGDASTGKIYTDNVSESDTSNVSGTVTLTNSSDIIFHGQKSFFSTLTLTADRNISIETSVETTVGNFTATADADSDDEGKFTLDTGKTLTSAGNVTIDAVQIERFGSIDATGSTTLTGELVTTDSGNTKKKKPDQAEASLFTNALMGIAKNPGC